MYFIYLKVTKSFEMKLLNLGKHNQGRSQRSKKGGDIGECQVYIGCATEFFLK